MTTKKWIVPYIALGKEVQSFKDEYLKAFERVLISGHYILGPELAKFEKEFADFCQSPKALGVSTGTDALYLALKALNLKVDDEVITAPNSFIASASSIERSELPFVGIECNCVFCRSRCREDEAG